MRAESTFGKSAQTFSSEEQPVSSESGLCQSYEAGTEILNVRAKMPAQACKLKEWLGHTFGGRVLAFMIEESNACIRKTLRVYFRAIQLVQARGLFFSK